MLLARIDGAIDVRVASRCFIAKSRALTRTGNNRCSPELFDEGRTGGRVISVYEGRAFVPLRVSARKILLAEPIFQLCTRNGDSLGYVDCRYCAH